MMRAIWNHGGKALLRGTYCFNFYALVKPMAGLNWADAAHGALRV